MEASLPLSSVQEREIRIHSFIRKENTSFPSFRREKHLKVKKARVFEEQAIKKSDAREEEVLGW